jgi:hypothetical protein
VLESGFHDRNLGSVQGEGFSVGAPVSGDSADLAYDVDRILAGKPESFDGRQGNVQVGRRLSSFDRQRDGARRQVDVEEGDPAPPDEMNSTTRVQKILTNGHRNQHESRRRFSRGTETIDAENKSGTKCLLEPGSWTYRRNFLFFWAAIATDPWG